MSVGEPFQPAGNVGWHEPIFFGDTLTISPVFESIVGKGENACYQNLLYWSYTNQSPTFNDPGKEAF